MGGLFPPHHTPCQWQVSLPAGVLVVFDVQGWVLWCVLAHSRWLLAGDWAPWLCRASAWRVMCLGVPGLWVHGCICSRHRRLLAGPVGSSSALLWVGCGSPGGGLSGFPCSGVLWMVVAQISSVPVSGPGGQVCGSSHSLLHILIEKPILTSTGV
ncbi:hypothetical protein AMECASPLE_022270 [Ameca splendens]|uniref:Uncharacterized protein n=1 Tax=Ameca splendens TaxID=208324 RepID=A0ABV0Z3F4_9TELE